MHRAALRASLGIVIGLVAGLGIAGCPAAETMMGTPCNTDADCPTGQTCMAGLGCAAAADAGPRDGGGGDGGCTANADCDDHAFCNGTETCNAGACRAGTAPCVTACDEATDHCTAAIDADGDGDPEGTDCDDHDAQRFHGNINETNRCDNVDNDCDPTTLGPDGDHDHEALVGCCNPQADGSMLCGTDCDDTRDTVNTAAVESCDFVDDDCDGHTDEEVLNTYYRDADNDGYGTTARGPDDTRTGCVAPIGYVPLGTDCDDSVITVNPAQLELCNGRDDNCDANIDMDPAAVPPLNCHCRAGQTQSCGALDGTGNPLMLGTCATRGTQECLPIGEWGTCIGAVLPTTDPVTHNPRELACDSRDEDCDGMIDDDPPYPDGSASCYSGPAGTAGVGICHAGSYVCGGSAGWICMGAITPMGAGTVQCGTDSDCDGNPYENVVCSPGQTQGCADTSCSGAGGTQSCSASCTWNECIRSGGRTCTPGSRYQPGCRSCGTRACQADCTPAATSTCAYPTEVCNGADDDCDGATDEGLLQYLSYDNDGDGYGGTAFRWVCPAPGWITTGGDCRDSDGRVYQLQSVRLDEDGDGYCNPNIGTITACVGSPSPGGFNNAWATVAGIDMYFSFVRTPSSCGGDECYSSDWFGSDRNWYAPRDHGCRYQINGADHYCGICGCTSYDSYSCASGYQYATTPGYNRCFSMITYNAGGSPTCSASGSQSSCTLTQGCTGINTCHSYIFCEPCASSGC